MLEYIGREGGGISEFYFVEDIIFVEFDESMVSFIIGNNEWGKNGVFKFIW